MESDEESRTEVIDLLLTDDERANIELAAAFQQRTVNAFVVEALLDAAKAILWGRGKPKTTLLQLYPLGVYISLIG